MLQEDKLRRKFFASGNMDTVFQDYHGEYSRTTDKTDKF
jgi:hypothetical protein